MERTVVFNKWCCLPPCKSNPLTVTANILSSGFTPGQKFGVLVNALNNSTVDVNHFKIGLLRVCFSAVLSLRSQTIQFVFFLFFFRLFVIVLLKEEIRLKVNMYDTRKFKHL